MSADRQGPSQASRRKDEHIELASSQSPAAANDFDDVELVHHALDGVNAERVCLDTSIDGWRWPVPLFINGMTGGSAGSERINRALAVAAREHGMPVASGSVGVALDDPETARTFRVLRDENPDGIVIANLGAGRSADEALRAIELLEADALQVHLNAVQETVMPEGARDFSGWAPLIEAIVAASPVPVFVKEVGFGLSRRTLHRLRDLGVRVADVAGRGGTDFARIENDRRDTGDFAYLAGYGQSAVECLLEGRGVLPALLASGGVRTPLDAVRALALGADAVGVAGVFLRAAMQSETRAVQVIGAWRTQLAQLLAMLGAETVAELASHDVLVRGRVREFCELRGIDPTRRRAPDAPSAR
ncbi:isopentenyl-diphosphate delta-isomerase [Pseudoclavibacter endophyticus]|uniref:Isopentenyl-diphosphate delta-isomerase n=1 Tax=Pseudoclavibacter endophyticus TaxID=1778590 RepID=A0A6H9WQS5_9MICO|nr:type 2 isopentenyl-diphosphate Delta-isomerase [Pseudoclavibacter endophyticus]KAB1650051.1 type 2 isopentenyl-diphosphate Delta-isomerase [Pseudoclavibacter endophyticus]GGA57661.1 isopentenyl-diphosphate delta-isomerase [Pseudoclavibacter endophyticus]